MNRNYLFIVAILFVIVITMGYWSYTAWFKPVNTPVHANHQTGLEKNEHDVKKGTAPDSIPKGSIIADTVPEIPRLFGTIITNNNEKKAIFEDPLTKKTGIYGINDSVAGFLVLDIQYNKVILLWHNEEIEVLVKGPKDVQAPPIPAEDPSMTTSRPERPILPPGTSHVGMPGEDSRSSTGEVMTSEGPGQKANSGPVHPRFSRRPVHESFSTPLTPPPPISPTFEDVDKEKTGTKK